MAKTPILELPFSDNLRLADVVRARVSVRALPALARELSVDLQELAQVAAIRRRNLKQRLEQSALLSVAESDRLLRVARVYANAISTFNDRHAAAEWMAEPLEHLGGETPLQFCCVEPGAREVESILMRIEHGVYS